MAYIHEQHNDEQESYIQNLENLLVLVQWAQGQVWPHMEPDEQHAFFDAETLIQGELLELDLLQQEEI